MRGGGRLGEEAQRARASGNIGLQPEGRRVQRQADLLSIPQDVVLIVRLECGGPAGSVLEQHKRVACTRVPDFWGGRSGAGLLARPGVHVMDVTRHRRPSLKVNQLHDVPAVNVWLIGNTGQLNLSKRCTHALMETAHTDSQPADKVSEGAWHFFQRMFTA